MPNIYYEKPPAVFPAFDPAIIEVSPALALTVSPGYPNSAILPVSVGVPSSDGSRSSGDIAAVARRCFRDLVEAIPQDSEALPLSVDYNLVANISVDEVGSFAAINAVHQYGENVPSQTAPYFAIRRAVKYPGYPLNVAVINPSYQDDTQPVMIQAKSGGSVVSQGNLSGQPHVVVSVPDGVDEMVVGDVSLPVETGCVDDSPVLIQWINTEGGYDARMFNARHTTDIERTDTGPVELADPQGARDRIEASFFRVQKSVTVGDDMLTKEEYDRLLGVLSSPRVYYWDASLEIWIGVVLEDMTASWDSQSNVGAIEFSFDFPQKRLQL